MTSDKWSRVQYGTSSPRDPMRDVCFACVRPASDRYTLILEDAKVIEDRAICDDCLSDFRGTEWISVYDTPAQVKDGKPHRDETEESP